MNKVTRIFKKLLEKHEKGKTYFFVKKTEENIQILDKNIGIGEVLSVLAPCYIDNECLKNIKILQNSKDLNQEIKITMIPYENTKVHCFFKKYLSDDFDYSDENLIKKVNELNKLNKKI